MTVTCQSWMITCIAIVNLLRPILIFFLHVQESAIQFFIVQCYCADLFKQSIHIRTNFKCPDHQYFGINPIVLNSNYFTQHNLSDQTTDNSKTKFINTFTVSENEILPLFDVDKFEDKTFNLTWIEHHESLFHNLTFHLSKSFK